MSIDSVFKKCTVLRSDEELKVISPLLMANIEKHKGKFEKAAFTFWNESESMTMWNMMAKDGVTPTQAKRKSWIDQITAKVVRSLSMLMMILIIGPKVLVNFKRKKILE